MKLWKKKYFIWNGGIVDFKKYKYKKNKIRMEKWNKLNNFVLENFTMSPPFYVGYKFFLLDH